MIVPNNSNWSRLKKSGVSEMQTVAGAVVWITYLLHLFTINERLEKLAMAGIWYAKYEDAYDVSLV